MVLSGCHILFLKIVISLDSQFRVFLCFHTYVSALQNIMSTAYTYVQMYNGVYKLNRCTNKDQSAHVFVSFSTVPFHIAKNRSISPPLQRGWSSRTFWHQNVLQTQLSFCDSTSCKILFHVFLHTVSAKIQHGALPQYLFLFKMSARPTGSL